MRALLAAATSLSLAGSLIQGSSALAQTAEPEAPAERVAETPADRFGFLEGAQLQVTSGADEDNFTFRLALPAGPAVADRFSLTVATPLQGDDEAMPASLDALTNGTRVTLSWGHFGVPVVRPSSDTAALQAEAQRLCHLREPGQVRCHDTGYAMQHYAPEDVRREQRATTRAATDIGVDASVGFNNFEWFDRVSLLPREERRTDWSVAAHVARYLPGTHTALTGSVSYQRAFEAAEEERVCPAGTTDPEADCPNMRTAGPTRNENLLFAVGVRHRILGADGNLGNLAVAPILTYDAIDSVFGVDVPIYYMPDEDGGLNGGIRFGYRSDRENELSVAFFVGTTFDVFGGR